MKVIVCGGRNFDDLEMIDLIMKQVHNDFNFTTLVQGGQVTRLRGEKRSIGADYQAKCWAIENGFPYEQYDADWKRYGNGAGPIRNQQMLDESGAKIVVAFPGGNGTFDMIKRAKRTKGVHVIVVNAGLTKDD